jgi:hypothetical protein
LRAVAPVKSATGMVGVASTSSAIRPEPPKGCGEPLMISTVAGLAKLARSWVTNSV